MSAKIIFLTRQPPPDVPRGNGAREAMIDIGTDLPRTSAEDAACWTDWLLAELWVRGFKVVPLDPDDG